LGSPGQCAGLIADVAADFEANEVMIIDFIQKNQEVRQEMYRLLAREMGLAPHHLEET
jgi:RNA-binding protein YhbY